MPNGVCYSMTMKSKAYEFFLKKTKRIGEETGTLQKRIFQRPNIESGIESEICENKIHTVHITGVCGKATSSLAGLFANAGFSVSGSDVGCYPPASDLINEIGITFNEGYSIEHVQNKDLVIVANMFGPDNIEARYVREHNRLQLSMSEAISEFFIKDKKSIVVCGTHGKTTTTGLMAHVFLCAKKDPGFVVGGVAVPTEHGITETSFRNGSKTSRYFIIEGDEYDTAYFDKSPKFLHYKPHIAIVTSLEYDHADIYQDFEEYKKSFEFLAEEVRDEGLFVLNGDSKDVRELAQYTNADVLYYGLGHDNDVCPTHVVTHKKGQTFDVLYKGRNIGTFSIGLFGSYNLANALSVIAVSLYEGLDIASIQEGVSTFKGMKRRQEIKAIVNSVTIIDDFAHHPTAVRETLKGIREHFPTQRILALFEPRSNTSRKKMFEQDYARAFTSVDGLILSMPELRHNDNPADFIDGETVIAGASMYTKGEDVAQVQGIVVDNRDMKVPGKQRKFYTLCVSDADRVIQKSSEFIEKNDVLVIMSNGSFDGIHEKLIEKIKILNLQ